MFALKSFKEKIQGQELKVSEVAASSGVRAAAARQHRSSLHASAPCLLTLPMLRLLPSNAHKCKVFRKSSKPCHVGTHLTALTEYS